MHEGVVNENRLIELLVVSHYLREVVKRAIVNEAVQIGRYRVVDMPHHMALHAMSARSSFFADCVARSPLPGSMRERLDLAVTDLRGIVDSLGKRQVDTVLVVSLWIADEFITVYVDAELRYLFGIIYLADYEGANEYLVTDWDDDAPFKQ